MRAIHAGLLLLIVLTIAAMAGCSHISEKGPAAAATDASGQPAAQYKAMLRQPELQSSYVKTDTDIFTVGEVIEFSVANDGPVPLSCSRDPPAFSVIFQSPGGIWANRMGGEDHNGTAGSSLAPGASTQVYRFVTTSWEPGRYRIVHDCGVEREFLLRPQPAVTPAANETSAPNGSAASPACAAINASNSTPWIAIDPITSPVMSRPFTIRGSTSLPAGQELVYTIFSVEGEERNLSLGNEGSFRTSVTEGGCGINIWNATGEIQMAGEFAIGIMATNKTPSAIRRFTVLPA